MSEDRDAIEAKKGETLGKRLREGHIDPDTLHVGELGVSASKLNDEHWLEFYFRFFNASDTDLAVAGVDGTIECAVLTNHSTPDDLKFDLPPPALLRDRSDLSNIAPRTETIIVLQQFLTPAMIEKLRYALDELDGVQFYFDNLAITITGPQDRTAAAIVPLPSGTYLREEGGLLRTGRVTRLQVNAAISTVTSGGA